MPDPIDLDAYLQRIRWHGAARRDLATLAALQRAHMACIPFENLDVLLGVPIRLDLASLQDKLVRRSRGGYCFEHGTLLAAVLERLGFAPKRHLARVVAYAPRSAAPRTHMFLTVELAEGRFVVDAGFGGLAPRVPLPLVDGASIDDGEATHAMRRGGGEWTLHARIGERGTDAWVSTLEEENAVDFELGNHFTSTHPTSAFVNRIMARAFIERGRVTVMNRDVTIWRDGRANSSTLADRAALRALLGEHFGFDLPPLDRLRVPSIAEWD